MSRSNQDPASVGRPNSAPMRAMVGRTYGGPEVWRFAEVPRPRPGRGQVLVRVHAAAIDRGTEHLMYGRPLLVRPAFGIRQPRQPIPGRDLSGTVVQVGEGVTQFSIGDEVLGTGSGSLAEFAVAPVNRLAHRPAAVDPVTAAVLPVSGLTAVQAVRDVGKVHAGQKVLVLGASGGVGSFAVQIAADTGAEVVAVCSAAKAERVRALGASEVLDYATTDPLGRPDRYDVVIDIGGGRPLRGLREILTPAGTLVIVGAEGEGRWLGGVDRQLRATVWSPFVKQRLRMLASREDGAQVAELAAMVVDGRITAVIDSVFPLEQAAAAMRTLASGAVTGKVAIDVALSSTP